MSERAAAQDRAWRALMAAAQEGDRRAYAELLADVAPFVRVLVRRRIVEADLVEDVVQDVLLTVHRVRATYDPTRSFSAWLAAICGRRAIDAMRRRGRVRKHETFDETGYETFADPSANKEDAGAAKEAVYALLAELPPKQRAAVELVKVKEMSLSEAAAVSGQSVGALKVNIHRALLALRARLSRGDDPGGAS